MSLALKNQNADPRNAWLPNATNNLTAAGSTQGTALAIPAGQDLSIFTTVGSGTGVILPATGVSVPENYEVVNHGINTLLVYPPVGGQIGNLGANAGYSLAAGKMANFRNVGQLRWACSP